MNIALIVFGGKGERITSKVPKQFIRIKDKEMVAYTIEVFEKHPLIDEIVLVCPQEFINYTKQMVINNRFFKVSHIVIGGETRQESVRIGLNSTKYNNDDNILIHDGDRPLISPKLIVTALRILDTKKACYPAIKSSEHLSQVSNKGRTIIINNEQYDVQTPQCFKYQMIKDIHNRLKDEVFSDDISLLEALDEEVEMFNGDIYNFKVTLDSDLDYFRKIIEEDGE